MDYVRILPGIYLPAPKDVYKRQAFGTVIGHFCSAVSTEQKSSQRIGFAKCIVASRDVSKRQFIGIAKKVSSLLLTLSCLAPLSPAI